MGNQQCHQCKQQSLESQAYGSHEVIQQNSSYLAVIEKRIQKDGISIPKLRSQFQVRANIVHPHIVRLLKYQIKQEDYGIRAIMYYQYVPRTLRSRIDELNEKEKDFTQRQLFMIIYAVEEALIELQQYQINHRCINLQTIVLKNNTYKITDVSSTTWMSSYDLARKGDTQQFLSEDLLQKMQHISLYPDFHLSDDMFSLGMIALMIAAKRKPSDFYIWNPKTGGRLLMRNVNKAFREIQRKYSSALVGKIRQLIYEKDQSMEKSTKGSNLHATLQQLQQQMNKVVSKATSLNTTDVSPHKR